MPSALNDTHGSSIYKKRFRAQRHHISMYINESVRLIKGATTLVGFIYDHLQV